MKWISIWDKEPPRNQEIFFLTGDGEVHVGEIFSDEKLRKCSFYSFNDRFDYDCDSNTDYESRVTHWIPIPEKPGSEYWKITLE
jgi:hypothetical protein